MVQAYGYSDFRQEVNLKEIVILLSCVYISEERERICRAWGVLRNITNSSLVFYYVLFVLMVSILNLKYLCA